MTAKEYKLDMFKKVLPALDRGDKSFYNSLSNEEKKGYVPLVLMRAMSNLGDQNQNAGNNILLINYIVNIGFWSLSKHPELLHLLLCTTSLGSKQYHPWISAKSNQNKTKEIDAFLMELNPSMNTDELNIMRMQHDAKSIKSLAQDAGKSDHEIKLLVEDAKKIS
jgi:hypothetical protein